MSEASLLLPLAIVEILMLTATMIVYTVKTYYIRTICSLYDDTPSLKTRITKAKNAMNCLRKSLKEHNVRNGTMIAVVCAPPGSSQTYLVDCIEYHSSPEADVESRSNDRIGDTRRGKKKRGYPLLKLFLSWSLYGYPAMGSALVQLPRGSFKRLLTFLFAPSTDHPGVLLLPLAVPATLQRHGFAGGVLCNVFL